MSSSRVEARREGDEAATIRTRSCPKCLLCGNRGELLHENLTDRLYGAPGTWNLRRCANSACRLLWLDPMPLDEEIYKAYRGYYTHLDNLPVSDSLPRRLYNRIGRAHFSIAYQYGGKEISTLDRLLGALLYLHPVRRANFASSIYYLQSRPEGRLLEIGCGNGATLELLTSLGWQTNGLDFDPEAVERARCKGLHVHLGTLHDQMFPEESFDAIVSSHVIEHVPDPLSLLQECYRLLRPGGNMISITPNGDSWGHRFYRGDWRGLEPPRHLHIFARESLANACVKAGFENVDSRPLVKSNAILLASRMLHHSNEADLSRGPSKAQRVGIELTSLAQWAISLAAPRAAEELIVSCTKAIA
jgi:2-polyprenyl-3-methyl-5-hydroxy-6-metoxy-1,4-benzoquinol methylase